MIALGPLAFGAPLALIALIALPVLWMLLRATPPAPRQVIFAPLRLLQQLARTPETAETTPWWLIALRLFLAALVILALARPVWRPDPATETQAPVLVIVEDGWTAASAWPQLAGAARSPLEAARADGRQAALLFTAPSPRDEPVRFGDAATALARLDAHGPQAWPSDPADAAARLNAGADQPGAPDRFDTVWISTGVASPDGDAILARAASRRGALTVRLPVEGPGPTGLAGVEASPDGFAVTLVRVDLGPRPVTVTAYGVDGRAIAQARGAFEADASTSRVEARLPLDLRNQIARLSIDGEASAGATHVTGDRWRRPRVGLLAPEGGDDAQPLLSDLHYAREALADAAELVAAPLRQVLESEPAALVMVDAARTDDAALAEFVDQGGVLVRFAGPRLAARGDALLPVALREGGRLFGGALAWDEPQGLAPFADDSPFAGLVAPSEARVERQVLAEPGPDLDSRVWARLADGTPLVTAERRGDGWIILFHVTAGPDWSSLPLSGLFPAMLERVLALTEGGDPTAPAGAAWRIEAMLTGEGSLTAPRPDIDPIASDRFAQARASVAAPPGLWSIGAAGTALNVLRPGDTLRPLARDLPGAVYENRRGAEERRLSGPLLALALILLAADTLIALGLSGRLAGLARTITPALGIGVLAGLALTPVPAEARQTFDATALDNALEVRLAYVLTGDARIDAMSRAGLEGVSRESTRRSAVEPAAPAGVDIETDDILFFPMLYWPITPEAPALSADAAGRVSAYLQAGGLIVFDTRDGRAPAGGAPHPGLIRVLEAVDVPPLTRMPDDHVLGRTFYLLDSFPGRYPDGEVWVESSPEGSARDGASGVVIGSADWAAAWALDETGRPLAPVEGGPFQRELAIRFGVNLAMYALTGNYKADQVHVPAILERLGREP